MMAGQAESDDGSESSDSIEIPNPKSPEPEPVRLVEGIELKE